MKVINNFKQAFLVLIFTTSFSITYSQATKQITISVQGVEYEDPRFTALRENLKKNPKIKSVKPAFSEGVATLTLNYTGDATELWDEIPKSSKQSFKLEEINDDTISLTGIITKSKAIDATPAGKNNNQAAKKSNCFDCDYFPLCDYDVTISYGGKLFKGIRQDDNSVKYYYCENGVVTKKWETIETVVKGDAFSGFYDDEVKKAHTMIILKSNATIGTNWIQNDAGFEYKYRIAEKGITVNHEGLVYKDVIKVRLIKQVDVEMKGKAEMLQGLITINEEAYYHYYAKDLGYIKSDDIYDELVASGEIKPFNTNATNPLINFFLKGEGELREEDKRKKAEADAKTNEIYFQKERIKILNNAHAQLKGAVDNNISGLWKFEWQNFDGKKRTQLIRFNADGTLDYYETFQSDIGSMDNKLRYKYDYRIDGATLYKVSNYEWSMKKYPDCLPSLFELEKETITKSTEIQNGKPILIIKGNKYTFVEPNK